MGCCIDRVRLSSSNHTRQCNARLKQEWRRALPALSELLPASTFHSLKTTSVNHNTGKDDEVAFVNAITGETAAKLHGIAHGLPGSILRASRETLRSYLWHANDLPVSCGKQFTHYLEDADGVTAFFADGSQCHGALLIGADGVHSHVREQLLGSAGPKPVLSQYVPIFGEVDLSPEQYEPLRGIANAVILTSAPGLRQVVGLLSITPDRSVARYFWALMLRRDDPGIFADWVARSSKQELYDFVLKKTGHLHPKLRSFISHGGPEALVHPQPKFLEFVPPETLPVEGRVVLLGDAAHAMIPLRGAGANTAFLDACDLGELLIEAQAGSAELAEVVAPYVAKMIPRGREAVLTSRAAGGVQGDDAAVNGKMFSLEGKRGGEA